MTRVVISQPMFLPWIGLFEQVRLADTFVHYDDVQLPQGRSFMTRVQIGTRQGTKWLTAPLDRANSGSLISETRLAPAASWRPDHLETLRHSYGKCRNFTAMFDLAREIYAQDTDNLAVFNMRAVELIAGRIGLAPAFATSSALKIGGRSTQRLLAISQHFNATVYLTGHGAAGYLDHAEFDHAGVSVRYMNYASHPWAQVMPEPTPYVSILDLLAEVHFEDALQHFAATTEAWQDFLAERAGQKDSASTTDHLLTQPPTQRPDVS
jgi:WbqC-like protein family